MTRSTLFLIPLLIIFTFVTKSQEIPDRFLQQTPGLAGRGAVNYVFTKRGDLPILVSVWGSVRHPGRYEIPEGTNLGELLSLAGGPGADTRGFVVGIDIYGRQQQQARGKTHVRVSRSFEERNDVVLESRLDELLYENLRNFRLQDGDVIMIDQVNKFNLWDVLSIVSITATILLLVDRIFVIF